MHDKKYSDLINIFYRIIVKYPFRSLIFLAGTLLVGTTQVVTIGAAYPILSAVVGNVESNNPIILFFNRIIEWLNLPINLATYIILFLGLGILSSFIYIMVEIFQGVFIRYLEFNEGQSLLRTVIGSKWLVLHDISHGDFLNAVSRDTEQVVKVIKFDLLMASGIIQIIFFAVPAIFFNWKLFAFSSLLFGCSAFIFYPMLNKCAQLGEKWNEANVRLNENFLNVARSFKNSKAGSLEERISSFMKPFLYNRANAYYKSGIFATFQIKISELVGILVLSILLYIGLEVIEIVLSELALILIIFSRLVPKVRQFIDDFHRAVAHLPSIWRIKNIKKRCIEQTRTSGKDLTDKVHSIVLQSVSFGYKKNHMIIDNLNVEFKTKEFWAICGESGIGKTTVLDLISGIIEPLKGEVYFNGIDINKLKLNSLHQHIGYLTQSNFIFSGSLLENILWGNEQVDSSRLNQVIDQAQLRTLVDEKGLQSYIAESGQNLSGGQLQRIAIARLLLKDYDFILMDEPTASLDPETERKLITSLLNNKRNAGLIMVTHRQEYLKHADYILQINGDKAEILPGNRVRDNTEIGK